MKRPLATVLSGRSRAFASFLLAGCVSLTAQEPAEATALDPVELAGPLLINGGGETVSREVESERGAPPGWEATTAAWKVETGEFSKLKARSGQGFLRPDGEWRDARLVQEIPIDEFSRPEPTHLVLSAYTAIPDRRDPVTLGIELVDRLDTVVASRRVTASRSATWSRSEVWIPVHEDTDRIRIVLEGRRSGEGKLVDACFDDVRLEPFGRSWPKSADGESIEEFALSLDEEDPLRRRAAAMVRAASSSGGSKEVQARFEIAKNAEERAFLLRCVVAGADERGAEEILTEALRSGGADRSLAFDALSLAVVDVVEPLRELATAKGKTPAIVNTRRRAIGALVRDGSKVATRTLGDLMRDEKMRAEVLRQIAAVGAPREGEESRKGFAKILSPYLKDENTGTQSQAMTALGTVRDPLFLKELSKRADAGSFQLSRWFALALSYESKAGVETVLRIVSRGGAGVETAFIQAAPRLQTESARAKLRKLAIRDESAGIRLAAVRALAAIDDAQTLIRAARDEDPLVATEAVRGLALSEDPEVDDALLDMIDDGSDFGASAALRAFCGRRDAGDQKRESALLESLSHEHGLVKAAALDLLSVAQITANRQGVIELFQDLDRPVRVAAYKALARERSKQNVATLIERMKTEGGASKHDLRLALVELTGVDQGPDERVWSTWWDAFGTNFDFAKVVRRKGGTKRKGNERTVTAYHGIPIRADKLVFVLDLSGSMSTKIEVKEKGTSTGKPKTSTRIAQAKKELIEVLQSLAETQSFEVIGFGTDTISFEGRLIPATKTNVEDAVDWVKDLRLRGSTNIFDSLEAALKIKGAEEVFLLTDGGPSAGKFIAPNEIRRVIRQVNRDLGVRIHTIAIGGGVTAKDFLRRLAEENEGETKGTDG